MPNRGTRRVHGALARRPLVIIDGDVISAKRTSGQQRKTALDFRVFIGSRAPGRRTGTQLTVGLAYTPPGGQFVELLGGAIVNPFFEVRRRDTDGRCAITSHSETGYSHSQLRRFRWWRASHTSIARWR